MPENELWVFGMIEGSLESHKMVLLLVPDRSAATLIPIIRQYASPLSVIYSDQWLAYSSIQRDLGMGHLTVNHTLHFVDPTSGANTQRIESLWAQLKGKCKEMRGVQGDSLQKYLYEWMWRYNYARDNGDAIYDLLKLL